MAMHTQIQGQIRNWTKHFSNTHISSLVYYNETTMDRGTEIINNN